MFSLYIISDDGSGFLSGTFNTLEDAISASKLIDKKTSIEMKTDTGSLVVA